MKHSTKADGFAGRFYRCAVGSLEAASRAREAGNTRGYRRALGSVIAALERLQGEDLEALLDRLVAMAQRSPQTPQTIALLELAERVLGPRGHG